MKELGIYVHIPFCLSKCRYCNFYSITSFNQINDYMLSIDKEITRGKQKYKKYFITTIFIGGGTPSVLPAGSVGLILKSIKNNYNVSDSCEITIEANPNTINHTNASEWFNAGINRVSVGLQTSNDKVLKLIGRTHTYKDFEKAFAILKSIGFVNINVDLMIGLPQQNQRDVDYALKKCNKLGATHISAYTLILEEETPLYNDVANNLIKMPKEKKVIGMFNYILKKTYQIGYKRYEVSNFVRDGFECKHNLNFWNMKDYVGFGASAHSRVNNVSFGNIDCVNSYIKGINENKSTKSFSQILDDVSMYDETIMLGLRTVKGVNIDELNKNFKIDFLVKFKDEINELKNLNFIKINNGFLSCTTMGFYVLNQIILKFVN